MSITHNDQRLVYLTPPAISPSGRFDITDLSRLNLVGNSGIGSLGFTNGTGLRNTLPGLFSTLGNGSGFTDVTGATFIVLPNSGLETTSRNPRMSKDVTIGGFITAKGNIFQKLLGSTRTFNGGVLWSFERNYVDSPEKCTLYISSTGQPQNITLRLGNTGAITELTVPGALRQNVQTHVATVVTDNFAIVYVSGIPQASGSHSTDIRVSDNLLIGGEGIRYAGYRGTLSGTLINNIAVFNARLLDSEISDIATNGVRSDLINQLTTTPVYADDPSLVGYWNFTKIDDIINDTLFDKSILRGVRADHPLVINSSDTAIIPFVYGQSGILNTSSTPESKISSNSSWRSSLTISPSSSLSVFIIGEYGAHSYISHGTQASSTRGWEITGGLTQSGNLTFRYSRDGIEAFNNLNSAQVLTSGQIFTACATFDPVLQQVHFYVNGERARSAYPVSGISRPNANLQILARHDTSTSDFTAVGRNNTISQIALFNRNLSSGEVRYLSSNVMAPSISLPSTQFFAFDTDEIADPAGQRHIPGGSFAYLKTLGMTFPNALLFDRTTLDLTSNSATFTSKPAAVIFRMNDTDKTISNMRFWNSRSSALITGWDKIEYATSGVWLPKPILWPSGLNQQVPRQIPATANLLRQDGAASLDFNDDQNVSQYIYLALVFSRNHSLGSKGAGQNNSDLSFSLLYDYY